METDSLSLEPRWCFQARTAMFNDDILVRIFEEYQFSHNDEHITKASRAQLLAAALTCKAFCDPALNVLWKSLSSFLPLFKLLPAFQLVQDGYVLRGTISEAEWDRYYYYAHKVREFSYPEYEEDIKMKQHAKVRLAQLWRSPLLPTLRRYICNDVRSHGPFIHTLFISPTVEYVKFTLITDVQDSAIGTLLSVLVEEVPTLKTLILGGTLSTFSLGYVTQLKNLRTLELQHMGSSIDSHLFTSISELEYLAELTIDLYDCPSSTFFVANGFKCLKSLYITAFFSVIESILVSLPNEVELESLGLTAPPIDLPLGWETHFTSLCNTMLSLWPSSLRKIHIEHEWSGRGCMPLSLLMLTPLLLLPNIIYFAVQDFYLTLDEAGVVQLASAWPLLQELLLPLEDNIIPQASFVTLFKLAELCPDLSRLEIPIDTSNIPPITAEHPRHIALQSLYIANENLTTDPQVLLLIARHLDRLFPYLKKLGRQKVNIIESITWDKVFAMIQAFRFVRLESS